MSFSLRLVPLFAQCENDRTPILSIIESMKLDASIDPEKIHEMAFPVYLQGSVARCFG